MDIIPSLASSRLCPRTQGLLFLLLSNMDFITENILLIITFVGSAILLAFPSLSKSKNSGLSPAEVVIQVNDKDAQLVDVRTPNEYSKGSLAGAVNIPIWFPAWKHSIKTVLSFSSHKTADALSRNSNSLRAKAFPTSMS